MVALCYGRLCLADWEEILLCFSQHIKVAILLGNSLIFINFFSLLIQLRGEKMFYLPLSSSIANPCWMTLYITMNAKYQLDLTVIREASHVLLTLD